MRRVQLLVLAVLFAVGLFAPPARAQEFTCFPETNECIGGRFREYWLQNGGLPVFGYPIGEESIYEDPDTGETLVYQWFERNVFELHPENAAPYDVLLARLGDEHLLLRGIDWQNLSRENGAQAGCIWFAETGRNVCDQGTGTGFKTYWQTHGLEFDGRRGTSYQESLALFGLPLTAPRMETNYSGHTVLTQWFERARFEYHPNNPAEHRVLLGLLGNEYPEEDPEPTAPPPDDPCAHIAPPTDAIIEPNCVRFGQSFYVEAYGFDPNQKVGFWVTHIESGDTIGTAQTVNVDAQGRIGGTINTRNFGGYQLGPGNYVFVVRDAEPDAQGRIYPDSLAPFRVIP